MTETRIVIIGAGVSGLTTALLLAKNSRNKIMIVAKHMPGDMDIEYASPWAGADYFPMAKAGSTAAKWEHETWGVLADLTKNVPEAGIHFQKARSYNRDKDIDREDMKAGSDLNSLNPWFKDTVPDFKVLTPEELPHGYDSGIEFGSVCINVPIYLAYLVGQCRKHGVMLKRGVLSHITEANKMHHSGHDADVVINCTGLMASTLGGVNDKTVIPARGQLVIVRNDGGMNVGTSGTDDGEDESVYHMTRAAGGGTILGGCYQLGNWDSQPDPNLAMRIMKRAVTLNSALTGGRGIEGLSIIRHAVGLRPYRKEGVRLEKEMIDGVWVVHNYGHAGFGYQASFGCSEAVVKLVDEIVSGMDGS